MISKIFKAFFWRRRREEQMAFYVAGFKAGHNLGFLEGEHTFSLSHEEVMKMMGKVVPAFDEYDGLISSELLESLVIQSKAKLGVEDTAKGYVLTIPEKDEIPAVELP